MNLVILTINHNQAVSSHLEADHHRNLSSGGADNAESVLGTSTDASFLF